MSELLNNVDWASVLHKTVTEMEKMFSIRIVINEPVVLEITSLVDQNLKDISIARPNVAKIAGQVTFWLRKLKPLYIDSSSENYLVLLNEYAALFVGLTICNLYKDDNSASSEITLPVRILNDWLENLRYHSNSPRSSMMAFELLACNK